MVDEKNESKDESKKEDKIPDIPETKEIYSHRFDVISKIFDDIDTVLASADSKEHLTIFEMEILVLMLRKKIEHFGIIAALDPHNEESHEGNSEIYK